MGAPQDSPFTSGGDEPENAALAATPSGGQEKAQGEIHSSYPPESTPLWAASENIPLEAYEQHWERHSIEWPEPADFWRGYAGVPEIEPRWLPECIGPYVLGQAALKGVDPAQVALNAVVAISGALHNSIGIRPYAGEEDYIERPILWGACVGNSSVKKGAAQDIVMGRLRELDLEMRRSAATRLQARRDEQQVYEQRLATWVRESAKGPGAGERPLAPEPIEQDRLLVENFTMEGLRSVLEFNARGKVFGCFDEIASLFGNLDAYSAQRGAGKDAPLLLKLYESKAGMFDRAAPAAPIYIKSFAASILGGIQPATLSRIVSRLSMTENGLLQRFMLVMAKPTMPPNRRLADGEARLRWTQMIDRLVEMRAGVAPVRYSEEAQAVAEDLTSWVYRGARVAATDGLAAAMGKFEGLFHRLSLCYHAAKCADMGRDTLTDAVSGDTALRVAGFIREFLFHHTRSFYAEMEASSPSFNPLRSVAAMILAQNLNDFTTTHLWRNWFGWRKLEPALRKNVLAGLCESGWTRKRSDTAFIVNPLVHERMADRAAIERAKREEDAQAIAQMRERAAGQD